MKHIAKSPLTGSEHGTKIGGGVTESCNLGGQKRAGFYISQILKNGEPDRKEGSDCLKEATLKHRVYYFLCL